MGYHLKKVKLYPRIKIKFQPTVLITVAILLSLLLLLSCGQVVAQKDTAKDEILQLRMTKGAIFPTYMKRSDTTFKAVSTLPDGSFIIHGTDSLGAIKILLKSLQELQQEKEELKTNFKKSVTFSNTIPLTYKNSKEWKEYLAVMKKLGYQKIEK